MNVDSQEIAKFDTLAKSWWDPAGGSKPLHEINPLRLRFIAEHCDIKGKTVLDVGCGGGILTESMALKGAIATGLDMAEQAIKVAKEHAKQHDVDVHYVCQPLENFSQKHQGRFDVITCMEMLEHVPDPTSIIAACAKALKPEGIAFFSTLNRNPRAFIEAIVGAEYLLKMLPTGTHHYDKFIRPDELIRWCRHSDLEPIATKGLIYSPISKRYRLASKLHTNYLLACQRAS